jgi:hypothetical protein
MQKSKNGTPRIPVNSPKINCGKRKQTPAQRTVEIFGLLLQIVRTEWRMIRGLNLGERFLEIIDALTYGIETG